MAVAPTLSQICQRLRVRLHSFTPRFSNFWELVTSVPEGIGYGTLLLGRVALFDTSNFIEPKQAVSQSVPGYRFLYDRRVFSIAGLELIA